MTGVAAYEEGEDGRERWDDDDDEEVRIPLVEAAEEEEEDNLSRECALAFLASFSLDLSNWATISLDALRRELKEGNRFWPNKEDFGDDDSDDGEQWTLADVGDNEVESIGVTVDNGGDNNPSSIPVAHGVTWIAGIPSSFLSK